LIKEKRWAIPRGFNIQPAVLSREFIASTCGVNLTAADALDLTRESHEAINNKKRSIDAAKLRTKLLRDLNSEFQPAENTLIIFESKL
jgi:hypothetical protein